LDSRQTLHSGRLPQELNIIDSKVELSEQEVDRRRQLTSSVNIKTSQVENRIKYTRRKRTRVVDGETTIVCHWHRCEVMAQKNWESVALFYRGSGSLPYIFVRVQDELMRGLCDRRLFGHDDVMDMLASRFPVGVFSHFDIATKKYVIPAYRISNNSEAVPSQDWDIKAFLGRIPCRLDCTHDLELFVFSDGTSGVLPYYWGEVRMKR
jgi:hypothetical protein